MHSLDAVNAVERKWIDDLLERSHIAIMQLTANINQAYNFRQGESTTTSVISGSAKRSIET